MPDKTLKCVDCGTEFVFTEAQQERFRELGFTNEPKRCGPCRAEKKKRNSKNGGKQGEQKSGPRELFTVECDECGGEARVPFKPSGGRPVYCSTCFEKRRATR